MHQTDSNRRSAYSHIGSFGTTNIWPPAHLSMLQTGSCFFTPSRSCTIPCVPLSSHGGVASLEPAGVQNFRDSLTHTSLQKTTHPQHLNSDFNQVRPIWVSMRSEFTHPSIKAPSMPPYLTLHATETSSGNNSPLHSLCAGQQQPVKASR